MPTSRRAAALVFAVVVAGCGGDGGAADADSAASAASAASTPVAGVGNDSGAALPGCPATGLWSQCALLERLDRSGLVPKLDSTAVAEEPPLAAKGFVIGFSRGEMEVYLFPDAATREREQARLDRAKYAEYGAALSMANQPTLIASGNALAVLHSMNDHFRERVGDAITAGAPPKAP